MGLRSHRGSLGTGANHGVFLGVLAAATNLDSGDVTGAAGDGAGSLARSGLYTP